ncbi:MAG: M24 family metallopeptidase [Promethearchaeota archaeon]
MKDWKEVVIENGMIFTIEPYIAVEGVGGFRLENDILIKNGKMIFLTEGKPIQI